MQRVTAHLVFATRGRALRACCGGWPRRVEFGIGAILTHEFGPVTVTVPCTLWRATAVADAVTCRRFRVARHLRRSEPYRFALRVICRPPDPRFRHHSAPVALGLRKTVKSRPRTRAAVNWMHAAMITFPRVGRRVARPQAGTRRPWRRAARSSSGAAVCNAARVTGDRRSAPAGSRSIASSMLAWAQPAASAASAPATRNQVSSIETSRTRVRSGQRNHASHASTATASANGEGHPGSSMDGPAGSGCGA